MRCAFVELSLLCGWRSLEDIVVVSALRQRTFSASHHCARHDEMSDLLSDRISKRVSLPSTGKFECGMAQVHRRVPFEFRVDDATVASKPNYPRNGLIGAGAGQVELSSHL